MKQLSKAEICERQFDSYCKITIKRLVKDKMRKSQRIARHEINFSSIPLIVETIGEAHSYSIEDTVSLNEIENDALSRALRELPILRRKIVLMAYVQGRSDVEIARLLEIPQSTARYNRIQAMQILRKRLSGSNHD